MSEKPKQEFNAQRAITDALQQAFEGEHTLVCVWRVDDNGMTQLTRVTDGWPKNKYPDAVGMLVQQAMMEVAPPEAKQTEPLPKAPFPFPLPLGYLQGQEVETPLEVLTAGDPTPDPITQEIHADELDENGSDVELKGGLDD